MTALTEARLDILIAEDEEHIAKLISFKLSKEGFRVTVAKNGQEAIDQLRSKPWGLIILDVMMPLKDGWEVLKAVQSSQDLKRIPVLMLTAKTLQKDVASAAELGATHFLKKPFDPAELAATARRLTGMKPA